MGAQTDRIAEFIHLPSPEDKLRAVCQRVKRCYERGQTVAVHVADRDEAERLDDLMWTFEDGAFIPHVVCSEAEQPAIEPVVIYWGDEPLGEAQVLVEAAGGEPTGRFEQFDHVVDFAETYDEALRELSRCRYKACQEAGYRMRYVREGRDRRA